jgi:dTDP-3-amino-3,6-dideoxy-alpha-D-glucopyranose N,N-dimethyltransferase/dTDP-3-amino-3,4,6-trideoxy-alpha-D-glucopyranose N,N-dimethyltransferase
MRTFTLGYRFDAVVCMFATIARQRTTSELTATLRRFGRHLWPGGVVVVDPWWFPEAFLPGHVTAEVVTPQGQTIVRVSHTTRTGEESRTELHCVVADPEHGIRHFAETRRHRLFSRQEYEGALRAAGFTAEYVPQPQSGRGLFVGIWGGGAA